MKYRSFEELPVWKDAIELAVRIFELTTRACFRRHSGTRNQLENATVSISNNIAEGFERRHHARVADIYLHRSWLCWRSALDAPSSGARPRI